ncbi:MAG: hypothetical protein K0Q52_148 [Microbacterium sp.]|jgi:hypothetical protein|nr:hypothetical protein [Microbacterium sp.]
MNVLSDDELRYALVQLFRMPTARTLQTRIGASDLCDRCDRCLAMKMRGIERTSPQAERPWFGREWGTAGHGLMESRINEVTKWERETELSQTEREAFARIVQANFGLPVGTRSERRILICEIPGYGPVYGTIDIDLPGQIVDLKGSTRKKSALLQDFLAIQRGEELRRWVKQKDTKAYRGGYKLNLGGDAVVSLSYTQYEQEMAKMVYKMDGYFGQQTLYMHGRRLEGRPAVRGTIAWLNRDGNGYFDDPGASGYEDPSKNRDIWMLTFDYNHDYALSLIDRGADIFARLETGAAFVDFDSHPDCYACSFEKEQTAVPDIEVAAPIGA